MATPKKTPKMKAIIKEMAKLNPNIKALTYDDFINTEAKELLINYTKKEEILKQKRLLHKLAQIPFEDIEGYFPTTNSSLINNYENTAQFFGIDTSMKALINTLSCDIYSNIIIDEKQLRDGIIPFYENQEIKQKFDEWIELCKKLDKFKQFFDSLNKTKQDQLKQGLMLLVNAPFIENDNITKEFYLFLSNHRLSQLTKFKEDKLLKLNLPNVSTQKIAKEIHNFTKLRHLNK